MRNIIPKISILQILFPLLLFIFSPAFSQQAATTIPGLTPEEKETFDDLLATSKDISSESQTKLKQFLSNWEILTDNFPHLPPQLQDLINKANADGIKTKIGYTLSQLEKFDAGLKNISDTRDDIEKAINFYQRYVPDSENPFRSIEVMGNFFEDIEKLLPEEQKYEALKDPVVFLTRTGIRYFREGIKQATAALRNLQKAIKERAGNCFGYVGGDATADSSDPKRKAFTDLKTGDVICYTGLRPVGGEIWSNTNGTAVYLWSGGGWTKLNPGMGQVTELYSDWRLAYETTITSDLIIHWCNRYFTLYTEGKAWGRSEFGKLIAPDKCSRKILEYRNHLEEWSDLVESVQNNGDIFSARYAFNINGIRESSKNITDIISGSVLFEGRITDINRTRVKDAVITIKTATDSRSDYPSDGYFTVVMDIAGSSRNGTAIDITVTAPGFLDYHTTSRIYTKCMDLGVIELKAPDNSRDVSCGLNELYDSETETCVCIDGYVRDSRGICVEAPADDTVVPDVNDLLSSADCSSYPNTHPVYDPDRNELFCDCLPGYSWLPDYSGCEETGKLLASQADCSGYPNTHPVWDEVNKVVICDCLPGYVWDPDFTRCYPESVAQLSNMDCSHLTNTMPVWDPVRNEPYCDCLPGYKWRDDFTGCDPITSTMINHADCSGIPNSRQVYDPASDMMVCECMPGFVWNATYNGCIPEKKRPVIDMNTIMNFMSVMSGVMNNNRPGYNMPAAGGNNPQQAVVHQSRCNDMQKAGGDAPEVHQIDLGQTSGMFRFDYETFDVKDQIIITQGGVTIFNTGCVGEKRSVQVGFSGYTTVIEVRVNPNCAGSSSTAWNFTVHCPGY